MTINNNTHQEDHNPNKVTITHALITDPTMVLLDGRTLAEALPEFFYHGEVDLSSGLVSCDEVDLPFVVLTEESLARVQSQLPPATDRAASMNLIVDNTVSSAKEILRHHEADSEVQSVEAAPEVVPKEAGQEVKEEEETKDLSKDAADENRPRGQPQRGAIIRQLTKPANFVRGVRGVSQGKKSDIALKTTGIVGYTGIGAAVAAATSYVFPSIEAGMYYGTSWGYGIGSSVATPLAGPTAIFAKRIIQARANGAKTRHEYDAILTDAFLENSQEIESFDRDLLTDCRKHGDQLVDTNDEKYLAKAFHLSGLMHPSHCPYMPTVGGGDSRYARFACARMIAIAHICNNNSPEELEKALERVLDSLTLSIPENERVEEREKLKSELQDAYHRVRSGDPRCIAALRKNDLLGNQKEINLDNKSLQAKQFRETAVAYGRMVNNWQRTRMEGSVTGAALGPSMVAGWATGRWWTGVTGPLLVGARALNSYIRKGRSTLHLDASDPTRALRGRGNTDIVPREARIHGDAITNLSLIVQAQDGAIKAIEDESSGGIGKEGMEWYGLLERSLWAEMADGAKKTHFKDIKGFAGACAAALGSVITGHTVQSKSSAVDFDEKKRQLTSLDNEEAVILKDNKRIENEAKEENDSGSQLRKINQGIATREQEILAKVEADLGPSSIETREESLIAERDKRKQELHVSGGSESTDFPMLSIVRRLDAIEIEKKEYREKITQQYNERLAQDIEINSLKEEAKRIITRNAGNLVGSPDPERDPQLVLNDKKLERIIRERAKLESLEAEAPLENGALLAARIQNPAVRKAFALVVAHAWEQVKDNKTMTKKAAEATGSGLYTAGKAIVENPVVRSTAKVAAALGGPMVIVGTGPLGWIIGGTLSVMQLRHEMTKKNKKKAD